MDETIRLAGNPSWSGQTTVHPVGLLAVAILGVCVLTLPRRWAAIPVFVMACFIPSAQRIVVAGLDFDFLRIMVLFGAIRLLLRREYLGFVWQPLDSAIIIWTVSSIVFNVLQQGSFAALVNRLGFAFDSFGMYFLFRCLVRRWDDVDAIVLGMLLISIPVAALFLVENRTGHNMFSVFGGVPAVTVVREGKLRCQGAFSHAILAGCFWASLMPLFAARWWKSQKDRIWAIVGLMTTSIIVICCVSSTPVFGVAAALVGGLFFVYRRHMRAIRWIVLLTLITLHLIMHAPVWHLICRVSAVGGSTGYHRFLLIDQAIRNFDQWWFCGCSGATVASWGIWKGDVTNQYVLEGVRGGVITMILFFVVIAAAFQAVGRVWRSQTHQPYRLVQAWTLGVNLFAHCMMFIGVSYFGQIIVIWYLLLAVIGSMSAQSTVLSLTPRRLVTVPRHSNKSWLNMGEACVRR